MTHGIAKTARALVGLGLLASLALAPAAVAQDGLTLSLHFADLAPLDEGSEGLYEGWAIVDGMPVSTGVFNVNADGEPVAPGGGAVIEEFPVTEDVATATEIKISIEPADDGDPAPSGLIILGGALQDDMAELQTGLEGVAAASGCYILATPSDDHVDDTNGHQGIWWLTMPGPEPGLMDLPDLGSAWTYEGWVVDTSGGMPTPYSTGTFASGDMADSDEAGPMGGGPPVPGQDFVAYQGGPVLDLASGDFAAVISIEPVPDNSPAPFQLKPLAGMIGEGAADGCVENQTDASFPTGQAMLNQSVPVDGSSLSGVKDLFR
jgi:hypothetical protein